jgi:hypothetical protein
VQDVQSPFQMSLNQSLSICRKAGVMKLHLKLAATLLVGFFNQPCLGSDLLMEGRSGKILCYQSTNQSSDEKTCVSVAEYSFSGKNIHEHSETIVSLGPPTVFEVHEEMVDDNENRCRSTPLKIYEDGRYYRNGAELNAADKKAPMAELMERVAANIGHPVCLFELNSDDGPVYDLRRDDVTLDRPYLRIRWIGKADGYQLFGGQPSKILEH